MEQIWRIVEMTMFRYSPKLFSRWRVWLLKLFGATIGHNVYISNRAIFVHPWNIKIGNNVGIDDYVYLKGDAIIEIADYVSIGVFSKLLPSGHDIRTRNFRHIGSPIKIGNGAFLGADVFVGPGVTIGQMAVVGSRTNIYKDVPENTVVTLSYAYKNRNRLEQNLYSSYRYE